MSVREGRFAGEGQCVSRGSVFSIRLFDDEPKRLRQIRRDRDELQAVYRGAFERAPTD